MKMMFHRTNKDLARMDGKKFGVDQIMTVLCFLIMTTVVILPVVMIIYNTFWDGTKLDLDMFARVILREENLEALKNTVIIAIFATLFATIVGVFFAWLLGRSDIPLKGLMRWLFSIPFMIPPFLAAMAWDMMFSGRGGYINRMLMSIFNLKDAPFNINTVAGIIVIEIVYYFPFVYMAGGIRTGAYGSHAGGIRPHCRCKAMVCYPQNHPAAYHSRHFLRYAAGAHHFPV